MAKEKKSKRNRIDLLFITACISTSLVLLMIGLIALMLLTAQDLSTELREKMTVEVVLKEGAEEAEVAALTENLRKAVYTREVKYISKDEALEEMSQAMGVNPAEFLEYNPFYASLNVQLQSEYAVTDSLKLIEKGLLQSPAVREVNYQRELLDIVNENIRKVTAVLLVLALLLTLVSFTLINNTIKLTIYSQRFLLYSMKLVGAKWAFIRKPFLMRNLCIGLVSAIVACGLIYGGLKVGIKYEPALYALMSERLLGIVFVVVLLVGLFITWVCAMSSVNRFLKMKSGELYYI